MRSCNAHPRIQMLITVNNLGHIVFVYMAEDRVVLWNALKLCCLKFQCEGGYVYWRKNTAPSYELFDYSTIKGLSVKGTHTTLCGLFVFYVAK